MKSSIHFHVICNPMFSKLYDFILLYFVLYNFCYFSIFFIFYNHLFIDVYAHNSWCVRLSRLWGRVTGTGMPPSPSSEKHRSSRCPIPRFFIQGSSSSSCNPWPVPWKELHQKGAAASQQLPLHSRGISLYLFYTLYIGIRSSALLLLPQELPCEPLPFPFRSQPGRRRLLP